MQILIEAAQNGSKEAFEGIFNHLSNKLFAYAVARTSSRDDAFDIAQETFLELWTGLPKFSYRSDEQFYGFVFTIARRKLYRHYRAKKKTVPLEESSLAGYDEMEPRDYRHIMRNLAALPEKYRDILHLRYWADMTFAEIAHILKIREGTAKVRHHRAIKKLQVATNKYEK